jgi:prepilin-type processing-associated H-X9-DG protein
LHSGAAQLAKIRFINPRGFASALQIAEGTPGINRQISDIKDGTSNTIALSEILICNVSERIKASIGTFRDANVVAFGERNDVLAGTHPGNCFNNVANGEYTDISKTKPWKGKKWCQGLPTVSSFSTLTPPNGPSCSTDRGNVKARVFNSAASNHSGGVNAVLADGAVKFVPNTVDTGKLRSGGQLVKSGQSEFGIWGALGSIAGGNQGSL